MSASFRLLSYPLNAATPVWPGNPGVSTEPVQAIARGDNANTTLLHLFTHSGTHLDAPRHFNEAGPSAYQLPIERFIFFHPLVLEVPKPDGGFVTLADLQPARDRLQTADLCLLRTGWSSLRAVDPARYAAHGPILHPDAAHFLVDECPGFRGLATDAISIGCPDYPAESVTTHQILTGVGRVDSRFLVILEDLRIDPDLGQAARIYAWPLFVEGSDGSPCTIVAEF